MAMVDEKRPTSRDVAEDTHGSDKDVSSGRLTMSKDEYHLASLGYKQSFVRTLGIVENWAATFNTMNYVNGIPILWSFAMSAGGPQAALSNWTMVGGFSFIVSLALAEIASSLPTCGGLYFWSYRLGGPTYGPFISWMTAWWNWVGWLTVTPGNAQGNTNFLLSALEIIYPESELFSKGWFTWIISSLTIIGCTAATCISEKTIAILLRMTIGSFLLLFTCYWIWFPVKASGNFQDRSILTTFYNGINEGDVQLASNSYCWMIGILFGAWDFYGYDSSVHLAEETKDAQNVVARGMWLGTLATWLMSVPTLIMILFCMPSFQDIIAGSYSNNWAVYLVELLGEKGAIAVLIFTWFDGILGTTVCIISAQRITYAIARDNILPGSSFFKKLHPKTHLPVNAAILIAVLSIAINASVIGSEVAFSALTATATIATNVSYLIPIVARQTVGRKFFEPGRFSLGRLSLPIATIASCYICFLFCVLILPQVYPVTAETLNYAPIMIAAVTLISFLGYVLPFGIGGMYWFKGPQQTITEAEWKEAIILDDTSSSNS